MSDTTIMIVDDDLHLVLSLTPRLKANGYRVVSAPDAISAIEVAQKEAPDLVILDLRFPAGDGFTVLERMRELTELMTIPVIVLTAGDRPSDEKRALDAGATAFFMKPPDNHEFLTAIKQALGEPSRLSTYIRR